VNGAFIFFCQFPAGDRMKHFDCAFSAHYLAPGQRCISRDLLTTALRLAMMN